MALAAAVRALAKMIEPPAVQIDRQVVLLNQILEAAVNFSTEKLLVKFEDGKLTVDQIKTAVAKAGYEAVTTGSPRKWPSPSAA